MALNLTGLGFTWNCNGEGLSAEADIFRPLGLTSLSSARPTQIITMTTTAIGYLLRRVKKMSKYGYKNYKSEIAYFSSAAFERWKLETLTCTCWMILWVSPSKHQMALESSGNKSHSSNCWVLNAGFLPSCGSAFYIKQKSTRLKHGVRPASKIIANCHVILLSHIDRLVRSFIDC